MCKQKEPYYNFEKKNVNLIRCFYFLMASSKYDNVGKYLTKPLACTRSSC